MVLFNLKKHYNVVMNILSSFQENYLLIFGILSATVLVLGVGLIFLTGIIPVRKGRVAIIERAGLYIGTFYKTKYFLPIIYRRTGYYRLGEQKIIKSLPNGKKCLMTCEIENPIIYHYSGHNLDHAIANIYSMNDEITFETMKKGLSTIGINLIRIEEYIPNKK